MFALAKSQTFVTSEKENIGTIRISIHGTRRMVLTRIDDVLEFMTARGIPGVKSPQVLWAFMKMLRPMFSKNMRSSSGL